MWRRPRSPWLLSVAAALIVVAPAQGALRLQQRLLNPSELPGFVVDSPVQIARSAEAWYRPKLSGRYKETAALRARGFVAAAREHLVLAHRSGARTAEAASAVVEFKTARGARATLGQTLGELRSGSYALKRFAVPGIPGAVGAATSAVEQKGFTVAFTDGRFLYGVSVVYPRNAKQHPARTIVIAGARALYRRVHAA
jgi:hypothetical protein